MNLDTTNMPTHEIIRKLMTENERLRWKTKNQKKELRNLNRAVMAASFFQRKYEDIVSDLKAKSGAAQVTPQSTVGVTKG